MSPGGGFHLRVGLAALLGLAASTACFSHAGTRAASAPHAAPNATRAGDVRVETVRRTELRSTVRLYGHVVPEESRVFRINVGIEGLVKDLSPVTTGSQVRKGQWLATFSAPDSRNSIRAYMVALDAAGRAKESGDAREMANYNSTVAQAVGRMANIGMSPEQLDEIKRTAIEPEDIRLAATGSGFILARNISKGERFDRGAELYRIADLHRVWIEAEAVGVNAKDVHPGMVADVTAPGIGVTLHARVSSSILPEFNPATQSTKFRLEADNPGFVLRPDMYVDVRLPITLAASLTVPAEAVLESGLKKRAFVETVAGKFESRDVETGWHSGDRVQIVKGLEEGDRVVVAGTFMFDSESRMQHIADGEEK